MAYDCDRGYANGVVPIVFNSYSAVYDILTDKEDGIIIENNDIKIMQIG